MSENFSPRQPDSTAVEGLFATQRAAFKGFERISQHFFETAQRNVERALDANRRLGRVTSMTELAKLQTDLMQEYFDDVSVRTKEATELGSTVAKDIGSSTENTLKNAADASIPKSGTVGRDGNRNPVTRPI